LASGLVADRYDRRKKAQVGLMEEYQFTRALSYDFGALANMFTEAFTGYFFQMNMTPEALATHWRLYHIDGARSLVMRDPERTFVGMTLIGARGDRGWCGGFGIAPAFRGHGAGKRLAREMIETARTSGLRSLQLEVLSQNDAARAIYESAGLTVRRRVRTVEIALTALPNGADTDAKQVATSTPFVAEDVLAAQPVWQQELASMLAMTTESTHLTDLAGQRNSLVCIRSGDRTRILAANVANATSENELIALLRQAAGESSVIQLTNCPDSSPILAQCLSLGFSEMYSQDEMYITL
jgi:ribosomal protein S18 acetylase RimI-like enzyme